jgi:hypothetical protein
MDRARDVSKGNGGDVAYSTILQYNLLTEVQYRRLAHVLFHQTILDFKLVRLFMTTSQNTRVRSTKPERQANRLGVLKGWSITADAVAIWNASMVVGVDVTPPHRIPFDRVSNKF